ncbi:diguanylate cyclase [Methylorubrum sp. SB2]|uniref:GGDEF domain-containing protein n=1 Tax=Methylorubrum subtropicum TaxID=3138812 RepID=UPI00313ABC87
MTSCAPGICSGDIDRQLASGSFRLAFPPALERAFERETADERTRMFVICGSLAIILYDITLITDYLVLSDRFTEMVVARLGIFTPALILMMVAASRFRHVHVRESLAASGGILAVSLPMTIQIFSQSSDRLIYQYGSLLVIMFSSIIQRLRFAYAALSLTVMITIQLVTTALAGIFTPETFVTNAVFFVIGGILLLLAAYFLERSERRSFLFNLRSRLLHDQLMQIARIDALTGLYNRRHLEESADALWHRAAAAPQVVTAILLDVDRFKAFNDAYGHTEGDACLRRISTIVAEAAQGRSGLAFRYGGEEMLVLLPGWDPHEARALAEDIRRALRAAAIPHPALGPERIVTASFGVAGVVAPDAPLSALIEAADTALYAAKRAGRDCIWPPSGAAVVDEAPRLAAAAV